MGFNHAGDEIFYNSQDQIDQYIICKNKPGEPEDPTCSDTFYFYDPGAHGEYLGVRVTGQCYNRYDKKNTFL